MSCLWLTLYFPLDGVPEEVTVNPSSSLRQNGELQPLKDVDRGKKLPKLKNKLDERVLISKDSQEAAFLAQAAAKASTSRAEVNGE
eukprot:Seg86.2 transcript_id=Seg86.2/GoldUCD/mRNA.D3Y31 product="hypothetical protein" protein_id=Seg86.2/GoldUCD/D3Y31